MGDWLGLFHHPYWARGILWVGYDKLMGTYFWLPDNIPRVFPNFNLVRRWH